MSGVIIDYDEQKGYTKIVKPIFMTEYQIYYDMFFYTIRDVSEDEMSILNNICVNGDIFIVERVFEELGVDILSPEDIRRYVMNNYRAGNYNYNTLKLLAQYFGGYVRKDGECYRILKKQNIVNTNHSARKVIEFDLFQKEK